MSFEKLIGINKLDFKGKKILIIGAGWMARQYCQALTIMGIKDVAVVARKKKSSERCCDEFGYSPLHGGYKKALPKLDNYDLVIVATPIHELKSAAMFATTSGNKNILVEKPGALYSSELNNWAKEIAHSDIKIRIAYNRHTYPNLWRLKELIKYEGSITSCHYTFTEWIHTINFNNNRPNVYERWGISNSLHVIQMAHNLIGMPKKISTYQHGSLPWHKSGVQFAGAGITNKNIIFSYHADWDSAGRWGIEIMTPKNTYRLIPLEKLYKCSKGSINWESLEVTCAYPKVKYGVAEEIAVMLEPELEKFIPMVTIKQASLFTRLAENIFNYAPFPSKP